MKRAVDDGRNVIELDQTVDIPEEKGRITYDRIWYARDRIHVFYHIDGDIPYNATGLLRWDEDVRIMSHMENLNLGEGIIYEEKFYSKLTFSNPQSANWDELDGDLLEEELSISSTLDYDSGYSLEGQVQVPETAFAVEYSPEAEKTRIVNLDGGVTLDDHGEILSVS